MRTGYLKKTASHAVLRNTIGNWIRQVSFPLSSNFAPIRSLNIKHFNIRPYSPWQAWKTRPPKQLNKDTRILPGQLGCRKKLWEKTIHGHKWFYIDKVLLWPSFVCEKPGISIWPKRTLTNCLKFGKVEHAFQDTCYCYGIFNLLSLFLLGYEPHNSICHLAMLWKE